MEGAGGKEERRSVESGEGPMGMGKKKQERGAAG